MILFMEFQSIWLPVYFKCIVMKYHYVLISISGLFLIVHVVITYVYKLINYIESDHVAIITHFVSIVPSIFDEPSKPAASPDSHPPSE